MERCKTFEIFKKSGKTHIPFCPYNQTCNGSSCQLLGQDNLNLKEDKEQEKRIKEWQINQTLRN
jgi:hypothetical protein